MHFAGTLPSPNGRECIAGTRCYAPVSGDALRGHVLPCPTARWRTAAAYRQQSHPSAAQGAVCSFPPYPARAHPRDAAVPSCGGGRRRDERAGTLARAAYWGGAGGTLMRAAYLEHGRGIGCWLATRRSVVTARARDLLGRGRAAATRARIRTAALSAHQTRRSCCRYALRRDGAVSFARTVR